MKALIYIGLTAGSVLGGWIGSSIDGGKLLGFWGIFLGGVGAILGIWLGYVLGKNYF